MTSIETALNSILVIPEIQLAIDNANLAAQNAQNAADAAQLATDSTAKETSLTTSYVTGFTPPLLSATTGGVITIANHQRVYGDSILNPTVNVTGGTVNIAGFVAGDLVRIYYDQPSRAGGTVTYQYTIDPAAPPVQSGDRHSVGAVYIPATGSADGDPVRPPGYVYTSPIP